MLRALSRIGREMTEGSMDIMTDAEKETIDDQVTDMRKRAAEAKESGDTRLANKLFQKEQELLAKVVGKSSLKILVISFFLQRKKLMVLNRSATRSGVFQENLALLS